MQQVALVGMSLFRTTIRVALQAAWKAHSNQSSAILQNDGHGPDVCRHWVRCRRDSLRESQICPVEILRCRVIDTRFNLQRLRPYLPPSCIKILHCDTAQTLYQNLGEISRVLALQNRRGVTVPLNRLETPHLGVEHADYLTTCGNEFTINTFRYSGKPIFRLPMVAQKMWPWPGTKDFEHHDIDFSGLVAVGWFIRGLISCWKHLLRCLNVLSLLLDRYRMSLSLWKFIERNCFIHEHSLSRVARQI